MASAVFEGTSLVNMFVRGCWVNGIRRLIVSRRGDEEEFFEIRTEWSDRSVLYLHRSLADLGRLWQRLRDAFPEDRPELALAPLREGGRGPGLGQGVGGTPLKCREGAQGRLLSGDRDIPGPGTGQGPSDLRPPPGGEVQWLVRRSRRTGPEAGQTGVLTVPEASHRPAPVSGGPCDSRRGRGRRGGGDVWEELRTASSWGRVVSGSPLRGLPRQGRASRPR